MPPKKNERRDPLSSTRTASSTITEAYGTQPSGWADLCDLWEKKPAKEFDIAQLREVLGRGLSPEVCPHLLLKLDLLVMKMLSEVHLLLSLVSPAPSMVVRLLLGLQDLTTEDSESLIAIIIDYLKNVAAAMPNSAIEGGAVPAILRILAEVDNPNLFDDACLAMNTLLMHINTDDVRNMLIEAEFHKLISEKIITDSQEDKHHCCGNQTAFLVLRLVFAFKDDIQHKSAVHAQLGPICADVLMKHPDVAVRCQAVLACPTLASNELLEKFGEAFRVAVGEEETEANDKFVGACLETVARYCSNGPELADAVVRAGLHNHLARPLQRQEQRLQCEAIGAFSAIVFSVSQEKITDVISATATMTALVNISRSTPHSAHHIRIARQVLGNVIARSDAGIIDTLLSSFSVLDVVYSCLAEDDNDEAVFHGLRYLILLNERGDNANSEGLCSFIHEHHPQIPQAMRMLVHGAADHEDGQRRRLNVATLALCRDVMTNILQHRPPLTTH